MNTTTNNVKMFKGPFKENNKKNAPTTYTYRYTKRIKFIKTLKSYNCLTNYNVVDG